MRTAGLIFAICLAPHSDGQKFEALRTRVSNALLAQFEAEPRVTPEEVRVRLEKLLGKSEMKAPSVLRWPPHWGPKETGPVLWGVVYPASHHYGVGGSRVVVESYVVEGGKARLAGRGGSESDGVGMQVVAPLVAARPTLKVLVHGVVQWSSGHAIPGKAVIYEIDSTGVRAVWQRREAGLRVFAHPMGDVFTLLFHDEKRHRKEQSVEAIEVFLAEPAGLRRIVAQRY